MAPTKRERAPEGTQITIVFDEVPDRPTLPVTGAYGGPSPEGNTVVAHFYVDFGSIPTIEEHTVGAEGVVALERGQIVKRSDLTRRVHSTLVFTPESAKVVGKWLMEKAETAIQQRTDHASL